jgi:hypothetical protein
MNPLETYLHDLNKIRTSGAAVNLLLRAPGQPLERDRQDPQPQGEVHHQLAEPGIDGPRPVQPAKLDPRECRTEFLWKNQRVYLQKGWAFDPATWLAIKL